jgi:uncharacterized protein
MQWMRRRGYLGAEFAILFVGGPALVMTGVVPLYVIPTLVAAGITCLLVLLLDPTFDRARLWSVARAARGAGVVLLLFLAGAAALTGLVAWLEPGRLLSLPRERPGLWAVIMIAYPVFSVYPQEVIFRAFIFHRYRQVFTGRWAMIGASTGAFALAHAPFGHWMSVLLSASGGVLFAYTYQRTGSVLASAAEHALYGCFIFTIGLGSYFYYVTPV